MSCSKNRALHPFLPEKVLLFVFIAFFTNSFSQTLVIAHRGASNLAVENSLAAFEKAIELKADYIETDVHQTSDSVVVLMHDLSVNRVCAVKGKKKLIKDLSSKDFLSLKFKNSGASPPTLNSAIKFINGRCKLLIELKKGNRYYPGIEQRILKIIADNNAASWVNVIHSFDKQALLNMNTKQTGVKLQRLIVFKFPLSSFNFSKKLNKDKFEEWDGVNVYYRFCSRRLIRKLHKQNKTVYAWTVNKKGPMKRLIKKGVDGIITNKPEMVQALLTNKPTQVSTTNNQ